jgi:hypothetical protein
MVRLRLFSTNGQSASLGVGLSSGDHDQIFITVRHYDWSVIYSCNLLSLRSKSPGTHSHVLLSHLRPYLGVSYEILPSLEGQVPVFITRRNRVAHLEFILRSTVSRLVHLGIGPPFGTHDQILSFSSFLFDNYFVVLPRALSLIRGLVCRLQCNHLLVRSFLYKCNQQTKPCHFYT